jgi:RNA polymerase sigma-70 factor, ECF subfamily
MSEPGEDLGQIFARLKGTLRSHLRRQVHDPALADDLLQEVFVKALEALRAKRTLAHPTAWLYAVARSTLADHFRAQRLAHGERHVELHDDIPAAGPAEDALHQQLAACLRPFTLQLPAIYRDTLLAAEFDGATLASLAAAQGLSVSALKSRAARARAMLRDKVLACCEVEFAGGLVSDYRKRGPCECAAPALPVVTASASPGRSG